jgi:hypothetical protein
MSIVTTQGTLELKEIKDSTQGTVNIGSKSAKL